MENLTVLSPVTIPRVMKTTPTLTANIKSGVLSINNSGIELAGGVILTNSFI